jgi:hypothetical protein
MNARIWRSRTCDGSITRGLKGSDIVAQVSRLMTVAKEVLLACAEELFEIFQF